MVPLAEAWDSGARNWTTSRRQAYANDLGDSRTLIARHRQRQPVQGRPGPGHLDAVVSSARCRYVREWVAVKTRWRLTVDTAEKNALTSLANSCSNVTISVTYAY